LDLEVGVDPVADARHLLIGEVADPGVGVEVHLVADALRGGAADTEDVGERDLQPLLARDVDACDACHGRPLPLPLLVARVLADDHHPAVAADDLALLTDLLDAGSYFHLSLISRLSMTGGNAGANLPRRVRRSSATDS